MPVIIQATTIGGEIIEKARWELPMLGSIQIGHTVSICLNSSNRNLLSHVRKQAKTECCVDKREDGSLYIVVEFTVKQIRHMIDEKESETMCVLVPVNRYVEQVVLYVFDVGKCNGRFVAAVRS